MNSTSERQHLAYFRGLDGRLIARGDRVAATCRNYGGLRIGEVLEITGAYEFAIGYRDIQVKVRVELASDPRVGVKYDPLTGKFMPKPYTMTYDATRVVRLGG